MDSDALLQMIREMQGSLKNLENHITTSSGARGTNDQDSTSSLPAVPTPIGAEDAASTQSASQGGVAQDRQPDAQDDLSGSGSAEELGSPIARRPPTPRTILYVPHGYFLGHRFSGGQSVLGPGLPANLEGLLSSSLERVDVDDESIAEATVVGRCFPKLSQSGGWNYCELKPSNEFNTQSS